MRGSLEFQFRHYLRASLFLFLYLRISEATEKRDDDSWSDTLLLKNDKRSRSHFSEIYNSAAVTPVLGVKHGSNVESALEMLSEQVLSPGATVPNEPFVDEKLVSPEFSRVKNKSSSRDQSTDNLTEPEYASIQHELSPVSIAVKSLYNTSAMLPSGTPNGKLLNNNDNLLHKQSDSQDQNASPSNSLPPLNSSVLQSSQVKTLTRPKQFLPDYQFLPGCNCQRKFLYGLEQFGDSKLNSSCSDEGTHYHPGQRVVSFSLPRATKPGEINLTGSYKENIMENLHRMRHFYPGYSMRLYTDLPLDGTYCMFLCQNLDLFWCDIRNSIGDQSKMIHPAWKFLPLGDPSVELFLSRDIGAFINEREAAVVEEWLTLNKTFHLMRDKRRHNIAMLGGLWGARNDLFLDGDGDKLRSFLISMSKTPRNKGIRGKSFDQDILSRVIFYPRKKDIVAYDSYHCKQWKKFTMVRPFPVQRNHTVTIQGFAVRGKASAAAAAIKKKIKGLKCPVECRPSYGKDWEYC